MIKEYFKSLFYMLRHPRSFSALALARIKCLSSAFLIPFLAFLLYSLFSACLICITPPEFYEMLLGTSLSFKLSSWLIILASIFGTLFDILSLASLLSAFLPFIAKGRLALRLTFVLIIIPAFYSFIFFLPSVFPSFVLKIISIFALVLIFIPAFCNKHIFFALFYSILTFSFPLLCCELLLLIPIYFAMPALYTALQLILGIICFVYLVNFAIPLAEISAPKAAASVFAAVLISSVFLWSLSVSGIISPEISQVLSFS